MYAAGHISREEEVKIPEFNNHDEARQWFKAKYGDNFVLTDSEQIDDRKCYFYFLILDKAAFEAGQKELLENGYMVANAKQYMFSHQPIQIFDDGSIHIVH